MNIYNQYNLFVRFVGDIIITDPCYIIREDSKMNYKTYPEMEDYYSKYKIIGNGYKGYPTPDMYEDVTWIDMKNPFNIVEAAESYDTWIRGEKTKDPNIRRVPFSPTTKLKIKLTTKL